MSSNPTIVDVITMNHVAVAIGLAAYRNKTSQACLISCVNSFFSKTVIDTDAVDLPLAMHTAAAVTVEALIRIMDLVSGHIFQKRLD